MKKRNKETGFTLVELLVTILIISIVLSTSTYFIVKTISNFKENSQKISYENLKTSARIYVKENPNEIIWASLDNNEMYSYISINTLIDQGIVKKDKIDDEIKCIKVIKDKNGNFISEELINDESACIMSEETPPLLDSYDIRLTADAQGGIIQPTTGWVISSGNQSAFKSITYDTTSDITYDTLPTPTKIGSTFIGWYTAPTGGTKIESTSKITTTTNQTIYAHWTLNKVKVQFHMNGGSWAGSTNIDFYYNGDYVTKNESTIIKEYDYGETGINLLDWNNNDYINLAKRSYIAKKGAEWNLKPDGTGKSFNQAESTTNANDLCDASITDCTATLYVNWVINVYTLTANAQGGTIPPTPEWTIMAGNQIATKPITYDMPYSYLPTPTKIGSTFIGWYTAPTGGIKVESSTRVSAANDQIIYAQWTINKINIQFHMNGGSWAGSTDTKLSYSGKYITKNGSTIIRTYNYGNEKIDLPNWKNSNGINISKKGYIAKTGAEWNLKTDGTGKSFSQAKDATNVNDLCDASVSDCTATLYVNWVPKTYTVNYDCNGGTNPPASQQATYNSKFSVATNTCKKSGYTFNGWYDPTDVSWTGWSGTWKYDNGEHGIKNNSLTLKAKWKSNCSESSPESCKKMYICKSDDPDNFSKGVVWIRTASNFNNTEGHAVIYGSSMVYSISTENNFHKVYIPDNANANFYSSWKEKMGNTKIGYIYSGCLKSTTVNAADKSTWCWTGCW